MKLLRSVLFFVSVIFVTSVVRTGAHAANSKTCCPEEFTSCAKPLSFLTNPGLAELKNMEDFDQICPGLINSLSCVNEYSRLCMNWDQEKNFGILFHFTALMVFDVCHNRIFQKEFLSYAPCFNRVTPEIDVCFHKYSEAMVQIQSANSERTEPEEELLRNRCHNHHQKIKRYDHNGQNQGKALYDYIKTFYCSFREYPNCSVQAIRKTCGDNAASFSTGFTQRLSCALEQQDCMNYIAKTFGLKNMEGFDSEGQSLSVNFSSSVVSNTGKDALNDVVDEDKTLDDVMSNDIGDS